VVVSVLVDEVVAVDDEVDELVDDVVVVEAEVLELDTVLVDEVVVVVASHPVNTRQNGVRPPPAWSIPAILLLVWRK